MCQGKEPGKTKSYHVMSSGYTTSRNTAQILSSFIQNVFHFGGGVVGKLVCY
jgi:hypothetical protein